MPGYILHLTAASFAAERLKLSGKTKNDFLLGSLLPDAVTDKEFSHFRNPLFSGDLIEVPDLNLFSEKYEALLTSPVVLGYQFHLYTDRRFFREYLPLAVTFLDKDGKATDKKDRAVSAKLWKTGEVVSVWDFLSDSYLYGDYTRLNTWLVNQYDLPVREAEYDFSLDDTGITEADFSNVRGVIRKLQGYLSVPEKAAEELRVFDREKLVSFLQRIADEWS